MCLIEVISLRRNVSKQDWILRKEGRTLGSCLRWSAIHILTRLGSDSAALAPISECRESPRGLNTTVSDVLTAVVLRQLRFWRTHKKRCLLLILWQFSVLGFTPSVKREMRGAIHDHPWRPSCFCLASVAFIVQNQECHFCVKNLICILPPRTFYEFTAWSMQIFLFLTWIYAAFT